MQKVTRVVLHHYDPAAISFRPLVDCRLYAALYTYRTAVTPDNPPAVLPWRFYGLPNLGHFFKLFATVNASAILFFLNEIPFSHDNTLSWGPLPAPLLLQVLFDPLAGSRLCFKILALGVSHC